MIRPNAEPLVTIAIVLIVLDRSQSLLRNIEDPQTESVCIKLTRDEARKLLETQGFPTVFGHG
ncbi:hypothetical protein BIFDEN_00724 [Bifidobacterium dentium ATCC 27678]|nr:hypothetical protein BIFDEN_00724 [Bifidobacterium dentium ATCC 27678]